MRYATIKVFDAVASEVKHTSDPIPAEWVTRASVIACYKGGDASGDLFLEGSNDGEVWATIEDAEVVPSESGDPCIVVAVGAEWIFRWLRVVSDTSGGSGTLSATVHMHGPA